LRTALRRFTIARALAMYPLRKTRDADEAGLRRNLEPTRIELATPALQRQCSPN
jgi:hypothetical protein